jgi:hypothetical protein
VTRDQDRISSRRLLEVIAEVIAELVRADRRNIRTRRMSGASRARTGDLLRATQALFQLSYSPETPFRVSPVYLGEVELRCPQDTGTLTVPWLGETEMKVATALDQRSR